MLTSEITTTFDLFEKIADGEGFHVTAILNSGVTLTGALFYPNPGETVAIDVWKVNGGKLFKEAKRTIIKSAYIDAIMLETD